MFSREDLEQIEHHGLSRERVESQLNHFRDGFPFLAVVRAASPNDGIRVLSPEQVHHYVASYQEKATQLKVVKFVPASGAATRMFKELFEFVNDNKRGKGIDTLVNQIRNFAFWPELEALLPHPHSDQQLVEAIVGPGLDYGAKPKGLVTFHAYPDGARKAFEEHLAEGAAYAATSGVAHIHFTVSPEHMSGFQELLTLKKPLFEARYNIRYEVSFSVQKSSTDTMAVCPDLTPFRTDQGKLLFRPAGHGALIENLNEVDADVVFVKNIDNITTEARRADTIQYKKALAGVLLEVQGRLFETLNAFDSGKVDLKSVVEFIERELDMKLPSVVDDTMARDILNRPIRVCGMVRNQGEPGGGPFWVRAADGTESLQIAESSQIAPADLPLMSSATHFNPVDLVCGVRNSCGERFDLRQYTDPTTGFISTKSSGGRDLLAQELPGLWNGAMARWITIFVDVPITTFSPVKVVQDLLRPEHQ